MGRLLAILGLLLPLAFVARRLDQPILEQALFALAALAVLAWLWSLLSVRRLQVDRSIPSDRGQVGDLLTESISLRNDSLLPKLWIEFHDQSELPGHVASRATSIRGRQAVSWDVDTPLVSRGWHRLGPAAVTGGDPFGMFSRGRTLERTLDLVVYPPVVPLPGFDLVARHLTGGRVVERRTPNLTPSVSTIRDYVPGDPTNRISWTASARNNRLMVKEFDPDPASDCWLILDFNQSVSAGFPPITGVPADPEACLTTTADMTACVAASIARRALDLRQGVGLIGSTLQHEFLAAEASERQYLRLMEYLAVAQADGLQPLLEVLMRDGGTIGRHSVPVIITPDPDPAWVDGVLLLRARGLTPTVVLVDAGSYRAQLDYGPVVAALQTAGITHFVQRYGRPIAESLHVGVLTPRPVVGAFFADIPAAS